MRIVMCLSAADFCTESTASPLLRLDGKVLPWHFEHRCLPQRPLWSTRAGVQAMPGMQGAAMQSSLCLRAQKDVEVAQEQATTFEETFCMDTSPAT